MGGALKEGSELISGGFSVSNHSATSTTSAAACQSSAGLSATCDCQSVCSVGSHTMHGAHTESGAPVPSALLREAEWRSRRRRVTRNAARTNCSHWRLNPVQELSYYPAPRTINAKQQHMQGVGNKIKKKH